MISKFFYLTIYFLLKYKLKKALSNLFIFFGSFIIILSLLSLFFIYSPILALEFNYRFNKPKISKSITHENKKIPNEFKISIPKIQIDSKVLSNIDPYNISEYKNALAKGVVHAKGTVLPGEKGNMFIFSHSTDSLSNVTKYNAIFYLLDKLEKNDEIYFYYKEKKYKYKVTEKKIVDPSEIQYLTNKSSKKTVTLMTCWPFGTTLKRLLVFGEI